MDKHTCRIPEMVTQSGYEIFIKATGDNLTGDILSGWQVTKMAHATWFQDVPSGKFGCALPSSQLFEEFLIKPMSKK